MRSGAIDLDAVAVDDDDGAHRVVLHAAGQRSRQQRKLLGIGGLHDERRERGRLRLEAEGGAERPIGIAQDGVRDIAAVALGLAQHRAHVP